MPAEVKKEIQLEIAHVLFIDIVGYSKLLINEQSEQIQTLRQIVRGTEQFRLAEAERKLVRLPTGDGGALKVTSNLTAKAPPKRRIRRRTFKSYGPQRAAGERQRLRRAVLWCVGNYSLHPREETHS